MLNRKLKLAALICLACFICCVTGYADEAPTPQDVQAIADMAQNGDAEAQRHLGMLFFYGEGIAQDYTQAAGWFAKATQQGDSKSTYSLGYMMAKGLGVPKDVGAAITLLNMAAKAGVADALYELGTLAEEGEVEGGPDYEAAASFYLQASEKGNADATCALASLLYNGQGFDQDYDAAREGFEEAAKQGSSDAMYALGSMAENGEGGTVDIDRAVRYYSMAAELGDEDAAEKVRILTQ